MDEIIYETTQHIEWFGGDIYIHIDNVLSKQFNKSTQLNEYLYYFIKWFDIGDYNFLSATITKLIIRYTSDKNLIIECELTKVYNKPDILSSFLRLFGFKRTITIKNTKTFSRKFTLES